MGRMTPITPVNEDIILPITGADGVERDYTLKVSTAEEWVRVAATRQNFMAMKLQQKPSDKDLAAVPDSQEGFAEMVLGADTYAEMIRDGVPGEIFQRAVQTAYAWRLSGCDETVAIEKWNAPKAQPAAPANRAARRSRASRNTE